MASVPPQASVPLSAASVVSGGCPFHPVSPQAGVTPPGPAAPAHPDSPADRSSVVLPTLPLEPDSSTRTRAVATRKFLADVQGNILSTVGRGDHVALWLFAFADPADQAGNARVVGAAARKVTTALQQYRGKAKGRLRSLVLTPTGLTACGADGPDATGHDPFPVDPIGLFRRGMADPHELKWNHDPVDPVTQRPDWDSHFLNRIDGAWLIGAYSAKQLRRRLAALDRQAARDGLRPVAVESGRVWRPNGFLAREPFGYADGISQPRFFGRHRGALSMPLERLFMCTPAHLGCSFLVLRKLEQNVQAFRRYRAALGAEAADRLVGRRPFGAPLLPGVRHPNDFDFTTDPAGQTCPFTAHIRRSNPRLVRSDLPPLPPGQSHTTTPPSVERIMARRGVVYGSDAALADPAGAASGVGLLFMAYMGHLDTFRTVQGTWANNHDFPVESGSTSPHDRDLLLFGPPSDPAGGAFDPATAWIKPKGGEYFFVPTRSWLRRVGAAARTPVVR